MRTLGIIIFVFFSLIINFAFSKIDIVKDSRGTDFWLTFIPNYHNEWNNLDPRQRLGDSLYIFIAASEPTKGNIEYYDRFGNYYSASFEILNPQQMYIFKVPSYNFALLGFNQSGTIADLNDGSVQTEIVVNNSFHVTSEKEVSVYALSQAVTTSDAFMVLPTDVLGNRYFILSYNSDGTNGPTYQNARDQSTPSQFAIVAVEDNTQVTIYPRAATFRFGNQTQRIVLNRGEVYLVQARITKNQLNLDLTGTEIVANKPIAVFSGHQRATVPLSLRTNNENPSRDILIEQLPPVSTWGKNAIVVPPAKAQKESPSGTSIYRVLAAEDGTDVYVNGTKVSTLNQGGYYESSLDKPYFISANKPILVGAYKKTCGNQGNLGDPFFAIMSPVEQYLDEYRVLNAQAYELGKSKVYEEQYITVIIPKSKWDSFRIDGLPIGVSDISDVPGSGYVYATIRVSDGVHYLIADTTFGVLIYGYGSANSYGYTGGSNYLRLNFLEPQITTLNTDSCFISKGIAYKNRQQDASLSKFYIIDSLLLNSELYSFVNKQDTIYFGFRLVDIYNDGRYAVFVADTMNLTSMVLEEWIPGFTLALENQQSGKLVEVQGEIATGKEFCFGVPIVNYGRFPQSVFSVYLKNTKIVSKTNFPVTLNPSEKYVFDFCFTFPNDTTIVDTIVIENSCLTRDLMVVNVTFATDKQTPKVNVLKDSCLQYIDITISDSENTDKGLMEVKVIENTNCDVAIFNNAPKSVQFKIQILDANKDTYFGFIAEDSAGNKIEYRDTIPGFTLSFGKDLEIPVNVGSYFIGNLVCNDFAIYNFGNFSLSLDYAYFKHNFNYSVIPSTFPIIVKPKETFNLTYCFNPTITGFVLDTLVLKYAPLCKVVEIPFVGEGKEIELESQSKCNVKVSGKLTNLQNRFNRSYLYPNPTNGIVYFEPGNDFAGRNSINILDILGNSIFNSHLAFDESTIAEIDLTQLPLGVYIIIITNEKGKMFTTKIEKL
jgi:hypothetical protein